MKQRLLQSTTQILTISGELKQSFEILTMQTEDLVNSIIANYSNNPFLNLNYEKIEALSKKSTDTYFDAEIEVLTHPESLKEHLIKQINITFSGLNQEIATAITDCLNENGYLVEDINWIANIHGYAPSQTHSILKALQKLEPTGVYAYSLQECLTLQCLEKGIYSKKMEILLNNLQLIASNKIKELSILCNCPTSQVNQLITLVRGLNPKPGLLYNNNIEQFVIPEVYILRERENNKLVVIPNERIKDLISLNDLYKGIRGVSSPALQEQKREAVVVIKAIEQRVETVVKIVEFIAKNQYEFFLYGISYLKPMTLADIAIALNINESTVSRISNKYIEFEGKYYPIKFFFNSCICSNISENSYANKAIKQKIKELIQAETPDKPLSDDKITHILVNQGIQIARRTVAKYRESMGIAVYTLRRKLS
ncbi:MAG: RNA polymerase factor sigma-54 [Candidatus Midichloria sp.]|nr:RNA polymerase factor sigma-54 [Hyalomma marginatum]